MTAGLLAIEGAHALDGDPANVDVVADAGFRMMSPSHFFDNEFGGSAHGVAKAGLTAAGREMVRRMEARGMIVDLAHASAATIDDVLAMATRPVVASHTGVRGRRRQRAQPVRRPPARDRRDGRRRRHRLLADRLRRRRRRRRSPGPIRHAVDVAGVEHVGARLRLRRRRPGAVRCHRPRPAHRRAARRRLRRRRDREGHGRQRPPRAAGRPARLATSAGGQISGAMSAAARAAPSVSTGR